jgi:hypothetical protein
MMRRDPRTSGRTTLLPAACAALLALALTAAPAAPAAPPAPPQAAPAADPAQPAGFRDPGLPPELRPDAPAATREHALGAMRAAPRTSGAALQAQVDQKLRESFEAADVGHRGALTREEARAGGFGFVARHFDEIDVRHAGEVRFEDLQRFLQLRAASARPAGAGQDRR